MLICVGETPMENCFDSQLYAKLQQLRNDHLHEQIVKAEYYFDIMCWAMFAFTVFFFFCFFVCCINCYGDLKRK